MHAPVGNSYTVAAAIHEFAVARGNPDQCLVDSQADVAKIVHPGAARVINCPIRGDNDSWTPASTGWPRGSATAEDARDGAAAVKALTEKHLAIFRRHMVDVITIHADLSSEETGKSALDERVLDVMRELPRHLFVPAPVAAAAYEDMPLPIGFDKTISQPFMVALMTDRDRPLSLRATTGPTCASAVGPPGAAAYLLKPLDEDAILFAIDLAIAQHRL